MFDGRIRYPKRMLRSHRRRLVVLSGLVVVISLQVLVSAFPYKTSGQRIRRIPLSAARQHDCDRNGKKEEASSTSPLLEESSSSSSSKIRRATLVGGLLVAVTTTTTSQVANAGKPELDPTSGQLFSPKPEMLSGGSLATRGVPLRDRARQLQAGQVLQTVYETRFIAYLSRFLLTFDPSANAWWVQQGFGDTWDVQPEIAAGRKGTSDDGSGAGGRRRREKLDQTFAEFAESVEVGLADYFVGPYGSYSSLSAAKAGILAAQPAKSVQTSTTPDSSTSRNDFMQTFFFGKNPTKNNKNNNNNNSNADNVQLAKQGVLNLLTLLKARYNSVAAKRQLAILFSFISSPRLQPTNEIRALLGESDDATITQVTLVVEQQQPNTANISQAPKRAAPKTNEADSRTSPRRGGGYGPNEIPTVTVDGPPALGDEYKQAMLKPVMKPTSRVLRIRLLDGGEGYTAAPQVKVVQPGHFRTCQATAILNREGHVESVIVLDPGYGYGGRDGTAPTIAIDPPKRLRKSKNDGKQLRRAKAIAEMEYEISSVQIVQGGNGYVKTEPPQIAISPPLEDPDWFLAVEDQPAFGMEPMAKTESQLTAVVSEMRCSDGNIAYSSQGTPLVLADIDDALLERLERDPLELLPSTIRPVLRTERLRRQDVYIIPSVARIPQIVAVLSPRFRAQDPLFGGVGKVPVTKGANELKPDEYARIALSGAVCTVVVRTALNPLELVKTKQQLQNDDELFTFAKSLVQKQSKTVSDNGPPTRGKSRTPVAQSSNNNGDYVQSSTAVAVIKQTDSKTIAVNDEELAAEIETIGTLQLIQSMIALRGPLSLFQSADITFLASLVFGSFGFGATELFRRFFSAVFFGGNGAEQVNEIAVLLAAGLATVITAAAASPFEVLRVRSMGMLEEKPWTNVFNDFMIEKSNKEVSPESFDWKNDLREPRDWFPLWSGFAPILSRELPFAVVKFLVFDLIATSMIKFINSQIGDGALPVQVGLGPLGLSVSAASGAVAGVAGALVSHPADLILTKTSSANRKSEDGKQEEVDWRDVVKGLISQPGGISNLFVGLSARATFFFLVIGLQFFLYDYVKNVFQVGSDDLSLVLDVFYAVRAGLVTDY